MECGGSFESIVAYMKGCVEELDIITQKTMLKFFSEDFRTTIEAIKVEMAKMNIWVNLTMQAVEHETSDQGQDAKELEMSSSMSNSTSES